MATTEVAPLCALSAWTASLVRAGVGEISKGVLAEGLPPSLPAEGKKGRNSYRPPPPAVLRKPSEVSCGSVMNLDFIA
jgi:hypothetical protein